LKNSAIAPETNQTYPQGSRFMPDLAHCPKCGARLSPGLLGNVCPNCALEAAFECPGLDPAQDDLANTNVPEAISQVGPYKLFEKIGEGGLGIVYMAEQKEPIRRRVAVKLIKPGMDSREVIARFEAERQALALMDHPNIAKVFDGGATTAGRPYFVMELVRGIRITDYCDQHNFSPTQRLELFRQICQAVQHAHQKGIIHRDLKPSNILVAINDGVAVPKVIDFGIAKAIEQRLTARTFFTRFHQFLGTPAYTSPEQAEMSSLDIDTRSDIYSLGVLLYELLTGRTPLDGRELLRAGFEEMVRTIREREPARPSNRLSTLGAEELTTVARHRRIQPPRLISFLRGDLDWIIMKCLEKDRSRRYESANGLALDLERHLRSQPVEARPPSVSYRLNRFVRRNRILVGAGSFAAASLLIAAVVSILMALSASRSGKMAERAREKADAARIAEENEAYVARIALAQVRIDNGALDEAKPLLDGTAPRLRGWEWHWLQRRIEADPKSGFQFGITTSAAFSDDANYLVLGSLGGGVVLWRIDQRKSWTIAPDILPGGARVGEVGFTSDGRRAFAEISNELLFWDLVTTNCVHRFSAPTGTIHAVSTRGDRVVTQLSRKDHHLLSVWDPGSETQPARLLSTITNGLLSGELPLSPVAPEPPRIIFSPDLRRAMSEDVTLNTNGPFVSWGFPGIRGLPELEKLEKEARVYEGRNKLLTFHRQIWDTDEGRVLVSWPDSPASMLPIVGIVAHSQRCDGLFFPDGKRILMIWGSFVGRGTQLRVHETDSGRQLATWNCGDWPIPSSPSDPRPAFAPDGNRIATTRYWHRGDGTIEIVEIWDTRTGALVSSCQIRKTEKPELSYSRSRSFLVFAPDSVHLATSDSTGAINIWNTTTGRSVGGLAAKARYHPLRGLFSPDSRWLLTDQGLLWNLYGSEPTLTLAVPLPKQDSGIRTAFSSDGQQVACAIYGAYEPTNQIWVFDLSTGRRVFAAQTTNYIWDLQFSADNRRLLAQEAVRARPSPHRNLVAVYDIGTGKNVNRIFAGGHHMVV
jgi:serine/threonine protein kinase/WD40 repeat protein